MSEVTLKSLRADAVAAYQHLQDVFVSDGKTCGEFMDAPPTAIAAAYQAGQLAKLLAKYPENIEPIARLSRAVQLCEIARSQGLEAAMLHKLSGGNIDPRIAPNED